MSVAGEAVRASSDLIVMGRVTSVYGVKGWVKVYSYTDPMKNILDYRQWRLRYPNGRIETVKLDGGRVHGKGIIVLFAGVSDREIAQEYSGAEILVDSRELPAPASDEYYWYQLEGLTVFARHTPEGQDNPEPEVNLGKVHHLMETGANDVMVVRGARGSIDRRERLIPWLEDQVVTEINLDEGFIRVEWDPEF